MPNGDPWDVDPSDTAGEAVVLAYIEVFTKPYSSGFLPPGGRQDTRTHLRPWPACGDRHEGLMQLVRYLMAWDARIELLKSGGTWFGTPGVGALSPRRCWRRRP